MRTAIQATALGLWSRLIKSQKMIHYDTFPVRIFWRKRSCLAFFPKSLPSADTYRCQIWSSIFGRTSMRWHLYAIFFGRAVQHFYNCALLEFHSNYHTIYHTGLLPDLNEFWSLKSTNITCILRQLVTTLEDSSRASAHTSQENGQGLNMTLYIWRRTWS